MSVDITEDVDKRLDALINSCFEEYTLMNIIYKSDWYIKEDEQIQINKDVCHLVGDRLSDTLMSQLTLFYNEDAIFDIIGKRVYFKVTQFVIDHNNGTGI